MSKPPTQPPVKGPPSTAGFKIVPNTTDVTKVAATPPVAPEATATKGAPGVPAGGKSGEPTTLVPTDASWEPTQPGGSIGVLPGEPPQRVRLSSCRLVPWPDKKTRIKDIQSVKKLGETGLQEAGDLMEAMTISTDPFDIDLARLSREEKEKLYENLEAVEKGLEAMEGDNIVLTELGSTVYTGKHAMWIKDLPMTCFWLKTVLFFRGYPKNEHAGDARKKEVSTAHRIDHWKNQAIVARREQEHKRDAELEAKAAQRTKDEQRAKAEQRARTEQNPPARERVRETSVRAPHRTGLPRPGDGGERGV